VANHKKQNRTIDGIVRTNIHRVMLIEAKKLRIRENVVMAKIKAAIAPTSGMPMKSENSELSTQPNELIAGIFSCYRAGSRDISRGNSPSATSVGNLTYIVKSAPRRRGLRHRFAAQRPCMRRSEQTIIAIRLAETPPILFPSITGMSN